MRLASCSILLFFAGVARSADVAPPTGGPPPGEAMKLGERIYREGGLPSGEPMMAVAMGDIPVDGRMFTCDDCHQRSGIGSVEGTVITWPTNGKELFIPRRRTGAWKPPRTEEEKGSPRRQLPPYWQQVKDVRPAYTDETLARVLRMGVDPAGRRLDRVMPRYLLNDRDMAILIHYLRNLSVVPAPGVDNTAITFATVVTEGVSAGDRKEMLSTLRAYVDAHNAQSRHEERRAKSGPFFRTERNLAYRRIRLLVWELAGPPETWRGQLEARYREEPAFALLGGLAAGSWAPIHTFCEENRIPCILPITDLPVVSESDWYTLYFSKGPYQEGESAAKYLDQVESLPPDARVVQVLRRGDQAGAVARGFEDAWGRFGRPPPVRRVLGEEETLSGHLLEELTGSHGPAVLLLWLGPGDLPALETLGKGPDRPKYVFLSSTLLNRELSAVPEAARDRVYVTYPSILPQESGRRLDAVRGWLKSRKVPATDLEIQARIYFLGMMLAETIKHLRSEFFREYFLEGFDMMVDQDYAIAVYPRLTFGTGQRYASKGCYIVQLTKGPAPEPIRKSDWVIH